MPKPNHVADDKPTVEKSPPRLFSVFIPNCLLGERFFFAVDEQDAYMQYRTLGGINRHDAMQVVREVPAGSPKYSEIVASHDAAAAYSLGRSQAGRTPAAISE